MVRIATLAAFVCSATTAAVAAEPSPDNASLHAAQNPVANVISLPFQNSSNFKTGPYEKTQDVLVVQPVIPFRLNEEWNLITRWITPLIHNPRLSPAQDAQSGLGNLQPQFYVSPARPGRLIWGAGVQLWMPTATDPSLGLNKWGAGPAIAALTIDGPWVVGVLVNNVWAGSGPRRVNQLTLNPFVNYNMPGGWYLSSSPIATARWTAGSGERWTVPLGGGVGRLFKIDGRPVNARVQFFDNVVRPTHAPRWTLQLQVQFLFPAG